MILTNSLPRSMSFGLTRNTVLAVGQRLADQWNSFAFLSSKFLDIARLEQNGYFDWNRLTGASSKETSVGASV